MKENRVCYKFAIRGRLARSNKVSLNFSKTLQNATVIEINT